MVYLDYRSGGQRSSWRRRLGSRQRRHSGRNRKTADHMYRAEEAEKTAPSVFPQSPLPLTIPSSKGPPPEESAIPPQGPRSHTHKHVGTFIHNPQEIWQPKKGHRSWADQNMNQYTETVTGGQIKAFCSVLKGQMMGIKVHSLDQSLVCYANMKIRVAC